MNSKTKQKKIFFAYVPHVYFRIFEYSPQNIPASKQHDIYKPLLQFQEKAACV